MPARFREALLQDGGPTFILTPSPFEPCLHLYPMEAWEDLERKISGLSNLDAHIVRYRRLYVSAAVECELDKPGRVLIPPHLRDRAKLEKEVFWAGMGRNIEVWSKALWDEAISMNPEEALAFRQAVTERINI